MPHLGRPSEYHFIVRIVLACLGAALMAAGAVTLRLEVDAAHRAASHQRERQQQAMRQSEAQTSERNALLPLYRDLQESAQLQAPAPRRWGKNLHDLQQQLHLPTLEVQFNPVARQAAGEGLNWHILTSTAHVHLQLIHEIDLIRFLDALPLTVQPKPIVRQCRLERHPFGGLNADCQIDWINLEPGST